jgi:hypothetical protein
MRKPIHKRDLKEARAIAAGAEGAPTPRLRHLQAAVEWAQALEAVLAVHGLAGEIPAGLASLPRPGALRGLTRCRFCGRPQKGRLDLS